MNANDLAEKLKKSCLPTWSKCTWEEHYESNFLKQCAIEMLLEQSQEIEQLKVDIEHYADRWRSACGDLEIEKYFDQLKPHELMERAYNTHIEKSMGEVKDLIKKASKK